MAKKIIEEGVVRCITLCVTLLLIYSVIVHFQKSEIRIRYDQSEKLSKE